VPVLKNQRHEVFAQGIAKGLTASDAFRVVTPGNPKNVDIKACQMRRRAGVDQRILELRLENAKKATLSREQALKWLTQVITTGAGDVGPHDSLCQAHKVTNGDGWEAHDVKVPDKLVALQTLCKMCNWFSPEKFEFGVADSLKDCLSELRAQPFGSGGTFVATVDRATPVIELENGESGEERRNGGTETQ
jgi:hypothetical protein